VRQCLKQRLTDIETLSREVAAWSAERNRLGASVDWRFTIEDRGYAHLASQYLLISKRVTEDLNQAHQILKYVPLSHTQAIL